MRVSDPQTDVAPSNTRGRNVRSKNQCSMCPAIHTKSRSWLRSSSTREPSDPLLRVVFGFFSGFLPFCVRDSVRESHLSPGREKPSRLEKFFLVSALPSKWRTAETSELGNRDRGSLEAGGAWSAPPLRAWHRESAPPAPSRRRGTDTSLTPEFAFEVGWRPNRGTLRVNRHAGLLRRRPDGNDPTTGSPTVTLLRLLLPLNDQVRSSFRHAAATRRPLRAPVRRPH